MTRSTFYKKLKELGFDRIEPLCWAYYYEGKKPKDKDYDFNNTMHLIMFAGRERYLKEGEERATLRHQNHGWNGAGLFDDTRLPYELMIKFVPIALEIIQESRESL